MAQVTTPLTRAESEGGWLKGIAKAFNMAPVWKCLQEQLDGSTHFPKYNKYQEILKDYRRTIERGLG